MNIQIELRRGEPIPGLVRALQAEDAGARQAAAEALRGLGLTAWPDLLLALMDAQTADYPHLCRGAYDVFQHGPIAAQVVAPLLSELHSRPAVITIMVEANRLYHRMLTQRAFAARVTAIRTSERAALPRALPSQPSGLPLHVDLSRAKGPR
jgi:hypothetical protein